VETNGTVSSVRRLSQPVVELSLPAWCAGVLGLLGHYRNCRYGGDSMIFTIILQVLVAMFYE